jgi:hypothetical protein
MPVPAEATQKFLPLIARPTILLTLGYQLYSIIISSVFHQSCNGEMAEVSITPIAFIKTLSNFPPFSWLWRQVKVILTLLPGHESGAGSSPVLISIRLALSDTPGFFFAVVGLRVFFFW